MISNFIKLSERHLGALRKHLKQGPPASLQPARGLRRQTWAIGLETLDMARMYERALATLTGSSRVNEIIKRVEIALPRPSL